MKATCAVFGPFVSFLSMLEMILEVKLQVCCVMARFRVYISLRLIWFKSKLTLLLVMGEILNEISTN